MVDFSSPPQKRSGTPNKKRYPKNETHPKVSKPEKRQGPPARSRLSKVIHCHRRDVLWVKVRSVKLFTQ